MIDFFKIEKPQDNDIYKSTECYIKILKEVAPREYYCVTYDKQIFFETLSIHYIMERCTKLTTKEIEELKSAHL